MPTAYDSPADEHADLIQWALSEGIEIDAVAPIQFPGRGLGMVATRTIEENENILKVPVPLMLTIDSIPPSFVKKFPEGAPTHGILAAYFIHGDSSLLRKWDAWRKLWPQRHDFEDSMPILWPEHLRAFNSVSSDNTHGSCAILPPSASGLWNSVSKKSVDADYETKYQNLLSQQQTRLRHSWQNVINVFPDTDWDVFVYHWLIVGTRSFYYVTPGKEDPEDWADALGLIPVADYFNHSNDPSIDVYYNDKEYTFRANRQIEKGEEVYITYGSHTNDFLFIEYGFFLDHNPSDAVYLDDIIFQGLSTSDKNTLRQQNFYGNYQVTSSCMCFRTEAAACMKYMNSKDWQNYIPGTSSEGVDAQRTADVVRGWINIYLKESLTAIENLQAMLTKEQSSGALTHTEDGAHSESRKVSTILRRWIQIKYLCEEALKSVSSNSHVPLKPPT